MVASVFNARLSQTNVVTKTHFDAKLSAINKKILQIKQNIYSYKMNLNN